jgi:hypothetical protein
VVTPTPGTQSVGLLLHKIIAAAGATAVPATDQPTRGLVTATVSVLRGVGARDLYVLRAHRLSPPSWWYLLDIAERVPPRLWLVMHQEQPGRAQLWVLDGYPVRWHLPSPRAWAPLRLPSSWGVRRDRFTCHS